MIEQPLRNSWERTLVKHKNKQAIWELNTGDDYSFEDLEEAANRWREANPQLDACKQRIVIFTEANSAQWMIRYLALWSAGCILLPLDSGTSEEAAQQIAQTLNAAALCHGGRLTYFTQSKRFLKPLHLLKLTSGSTGAPKAIAFTEAQLAADGKQVAQTMGIDSNTSNYALIPFGHSYGLGNLIMPLIQQGASIICGTSYYPHTIADEIESSEATFFPSVPPLVRAFHSSEIEPSKFKKLKRIISAGAALSPKDAQAFYDAYKIKVRNFYGSSETGGIAYDRTGDATLSGDNLGQPLEGVKVRVSSNGRIEVESPAVFTYKNTQGTGNPGIHKTGDFGHLLPNGALVLTGRKSQLIKVAGRRLSPQEIEARLKEIDGVEEAFVAESPTEDGDTRLGAVIATQLPRASIRSHLKGTLPSWKIPKKIVIIHAFPHNSRGKQDRKKLLALLH